jgi:glycosyltransferase involved in cell wall biosynthesis
VRLPEAFDRTINAKRRLLWLHDADYGDRITEQRIERTTSVAVLSEFHRELMVEKYPFISPKIFWTRNGIETSFYVGDNMETVGRKPWLVYSSSPDRGLDVLLEMWPVIRDKAERAGVSEPQLHFTYSPIYKQFRESGQFPHLVAFHERIEELREQAGEGLVDHDSMNQRDLATLFREASIWAYPSWTTPGGEAFPEISCIGAMEAQAAGCVPVCSDFGALKETVFGGTRIEPTLVGGKLSPEWREKFISACVDYLADHDRSAPIRRLVRDEALTLDWSGVADDWQAALLLPESLPEEVPA